MAEKFLVTPWEVKGKVDYDKLMKEFGMKPFRPLIKKIPKPDLYMRRGIIFGQRDFERIIDCIKNKKAAFSNRRLECRFNRSTSCFNFTAFNKMVCSNLGIDICNIGR